ncbi:MAG: TspO/MBR family protein [Candidatus Paceibacterota bacterium]
MEIKDFIKLLFAIICVEAIGIFGAIFTIPAIPAWYVLLSKPALTPPSWVFGSAWTLLFALMGIAVYMILSKGWARREVKIAFGIFSAQLALNVLWSALFFGTRNPGAAFAEIIILWLAILATIAAFSKISKAAAWLLVPYILWVSFAAYLNYAIWQLLLVSN